MKAPFPKWGLGARPQASALAILLCCLVLSTLPACHHREKFHQARYLGGVPIAADVLNRGLRVYRASCASCHGAAGAGNGPRAHGMNPPPRDLRSGLYEFSSAEAGELPTDEDLFRTIHRGLRGTAMVPSHLGDEDIMAVVQYIKTFSPRWRRDAAGKPVWSNLNLRFPGDRLKVMSKSEWVSQGDRVYHIDAGCWTCHPAYETRDYIYEMSHRRTTTFRPDMYQARLIPSQFGVQLKATDFLTDTLKAGTSDQALFRTIAAGLGGTGMSAGHEKLDDSRIWALVYYVQSLVDAKKAGEAPAVEARLQKQAHWQPGQ